MLVAVANARRRIGAVRRAKARTASGSMTGEPRTEGGRRRRARREKMFVRGRRSNATDVEIE